MYETIQIPLSVFKGVCHHEETFLGPLPGTRISRFVPGSFLPIVKNPSWVRNVSYVGRNRGKFYPRDSCPLLSTTTESKIYKINRKTEGFRKSLMAESQFMPFGEIDTHIQLDGIIQGFRADSAEMKILGHDAAG